MAIQSRPHSRRRPPPVTATVTATATVPRKLRPLRLPILPLRRHVLFPYTMTALVIDTPEGVKMIEEAVPKSRLVALVPTTKGDSETLTPEDFAKVACIGRIVKVLRFPDQTLRVLVRGIRRATILRLNGSGAATDGVFQPVEPVVEDALDLRAQLNNLNQQFHQILALAPNLPDELRVALLNLDDPSRIADFMANTLNLRFEEKIAVLAAADLRERLARLAVGMTRELEQLKLGNEIQSKVSSTFGKQQREAFLREQLKTIQEQLNEEDSAEVADLRKRLAEAKLPDEARTAAERDLDHMRKMHPQHGDYHVARTHVEWLLSLPWNSFSEDRLDLAEAARLLDAEHYGMRKIKDRILEFLAVRKLNGAARGSILCLAGPPGTGKTSIGQAVAKAMGREFIRISLGGIRDEAEIRGHRRTYVGALPGRILQGLRRAKTANPVFMLDEIDKIGADFRGDPSAALLEALDPQQNRAFSDHYLEVPFDLSRVLFITTANLIDPIIPALRDRLEVLDVPGYTPAEKREIARRFLLPRQLTDCGLTAALVRLPDATLDAIITLYTHESGVRQLEREIGRICRGLARRQVETPAPAPSPQPTTHNPQPTTPPSQPVTAVTITPKSLPDFLGPRKLFPERATATPLTGAATGLAWTSAGGDVLQIETARLPGKGQLQLTGSLGEVMKESAHIALSHLRGCAEALGVNEKLFERSEFHIHVPAGATPKDGPSAGVTLLTALASLVTGRPVKPFLAMTGELSLRGRILPVGGIKEKVLAAHRAGVKTVLMPPENRQDLEEVPADVRKALRFVFPADADAVLREALEKAPPRKKHPR